MRNKLERQNNFELQPTEKKSPVKNYLSRFKKALAIGVAAFSIEACGSPEFQKCVKEATETVDKGFSKEEMYKDAEKYIKTLLADALSINIEAPDFSDPKFADKDIREYSEAATFYSKIRQNSSFKQFDDLRSDEREKKIIFMTVDEFEAAINKLVDYIKIKQDEARKKLSSGGLLTKSYQEALSMNADDIREMIENYLSYGWSSVSSTPDNPFFKKEELTVFFYDKPKKNQQRDEYIYLTIKKDFSKVNAGAQSVLFLAATVSSFVESFKKNNATNLDTETLNLNTAISELVGRVADNEELRNKIDQSNNLSEIVNAVNNFLPGENAKMGGLSYDQIIKLIKKFIKENYNDININFSVPDRFEKFRATSAVNISNLAMTTEQYNSMTSEEKNNYYINILNLVRGYSDDIIIGIRYIGGPFQLYKEGRKIYLLSGNTIKGWELNLKKDYVPENPDHEGTTNFVDLGEYNYKMWDRIKPDNVPDYSGPEEFNKLSIEEQKKYYKDVLSFISQYSNDKIPLDQMDGPVQFYNDVDEGKYLYVYRMIGGESWRLDLKDELVKK